MTGEMVRIDPITGEEPDGTTWSIHAAIAKALGGEVKPFDKYQGPYVVIGADVRIGNPPYQYAPSHLGVVRLWVYDDEIYREDTDTTANFFPEDIEGAVEAARWLINGEDAEVIRDLQSLQDGRT